MAHLERTAEQRSGCIYCFPYNRYDRLFDGYILQLHT